jgi:chromosome segregation ATPase
MAKKIKVDEQLIINEENKLADLIAKNAVFEKKLADSEAETKRVGAMLAEKDKLLAEKDSQINAKQAELNNLLSKSIEQSNACKTDYLKLVNEQNAEIVKLSDEKNTILNEKNQITKDLENINSSVESLKGQKSLLEGEIKTLSDKIEATNRVLSNIEKNTKLLEVRLLEQDGIVKNKDLIIEEKNKSILSLEKEEKDLVGKVEDKKKELGNLDKDKFYIGAYKQYLTEREMELKGKYSYAGVPYEEFTKYEDWVRENYPN